MIASVRLPRVEFAERGGEPLPAVEQHDDVRQPLVGRAAARCSVMSANPPSASSSWRRLSSAASRPSSRTARSVCVRVTTAPQCGRSVSASSAPLPQSIPYRCRSAQLCGSASAAGDRAQQLRAPAARRPGRHQMAEGVQAERRRALLLAGRQILDPERAVVAAARPPAARAPASTGIRSRSSSGSGSGGSHGLCWRGNAQPAVWPRWISSTRTLRSVISSSARCLAAGLAGSGLPRSCPVHPAPATAARSPRWRRRAAARRPGRPGTAPARRARAARRPARAWTWR